VAEELVIDVQFQVGDQRTEFSQQSYYSLEDQVRAPILDIYDHIDIGEIVGVSGGERSLQPHGKDECLLLEPALEVAR
jgi:hypothetical protein